MFKIIRITTVPISLQAFLGGFLKELSINYDVVAVSSPLPELKLVAEKEGVRIVGIPMERHVSFVKDLVSLLQLIVLFAKEKPDVVHSMTPKAGLLSMVSAWIARVPVRIHTFTGLVFPTTSGLKQKILMFTDSLTCACATYINPEGDGVKHDLQSYGITKKPLHIICHGNVRGVDMDYYDRTDDVLASASKYMAPDIFTFCFVGRLVRDKGINELIVAFDRLCQEGYKIRLLLVGYFEENLDPLLPTTIQSIVENKMIVSVGVQQDVRPFYVASDALVFPSYREGFPNVVLEAGALGLPSIVTDINGSNEIVIHGKNGIIIPSRDEFSLYNAMKRFLDKPELVKVMASNARPLTRRRYEQHAIREAWKKIYSQLLIHT